MTNKDLMDFVEKKSFNYGSEFLKPEPEEDEKITEEDWDSSIFKIYRGIFKFLFKKDPKKIYNRKVYK